MWASIHKQKDVNYGISDLSSKIQFGLLEKYISLTIKDSLSIIEIGAGNGDLCRRIMMKYEQNITRYVILEDKYRIIDIEIGIEIK